MFSVQVVVHAFAPEERLVHHPVTLAAVQFGRRAVGVLVAVRIVQRIVGHLAVQVVHRGIDVRHVHAARGRLLRYLRQYTVTFGEDGGDMAARLVVRSVLVAGPVVKVAHVRVVRHVIVELDHRVLRLADVQFREVGGIGGVGLLVQVSCQSYGTHKRAGVRGVALRVHAARVYKPVQPCAVVLTVDARHPYTVDVGAAVQYSLPVQAGAGVEDKCTHVAPRFQGEVRRGQFGKVLQTQGGKRTGKVGFRHGCALGEGHALNLRTSRVQFLQFRLLRQVKGGARAAAGLRLRLVPHVQLAQLAAAAYRQPPAGTTGGGGLQVQFAQHGAFAQVQGVLQVVGRTSHVEHPHAARAVHAQRVVHRIGTCDGERGGLVLAHDAGTRDVRAVVRAVAEGVGLGGGHLQGVGGIGRRAAQVQVDVVAREVARAVLRVQQREAVLDEVLTVRTVAALQGVDERPHLAVHLLHRRGDVFQVAGLVESPVRPVAALLVVEHGQYTLVGHHGPEAGGTPFEIVLKVGEYQVPQPRVVTLEGVLARLRVVGVAVGGVRVHEEAVVALAKLRVTIVVGDVPFLTVPRAQHHVLRPLVNAKEIVGEEVVGQKVVTVEVAVYLVLELPAHEGGEVISTRTGGDARPYPPVQAFQGGLPGRGKAAPRDVAVALRLAGRVDAVVDLRTGVEVGLHLRVARGGEKAYRRGVVQHLQGDGARRGVAVHALHAEHSTALALLVVEVVLPVVAVLAVGGLRAEDVDRKAVDGTADIDAREAVSGLLVLVPLRRGQKPQLLHHVVEQLGPAGVQGHGGVGIVALAAEQVDGDRTGAHRVLVPRADVLAAHRELFAALGAVDAEVLARVFRGARSLDTDVAVCEDEVVFPPEGRVIVDVGQEVGLLVVLGIDVIQLVLTYDAQHALPLCKQLVQVDIARVPEDVVLLVQRHHRVRAVGIHHRVLQFLVVAEGAVIDADAAYLHVGTCAVDGDFLRDVLLEIERGVVEVRAGTVAVDIELHQPVLRRRAYHQGDLHLLAVGVVRGKFYLARHLLVVLVGVGHGLPRAEARLLRGDKKPLAVVDAAHHRRRAVGDIAYLHGDLYRQPGRFHVGGEGLVAYRRLRTVHELQRVSRPAAAAPVHVLERGTHAAGFPYRRIALPVAASGSIQLEQQPVACLGDVHAAFGNVDVQGVGGRAELQLQGLRALFSEAVAVRLYAPRHADAAREAAVTPDLHRGRDDGRVVSHEAEGALLVLSHFQGRNGMAGSGEDAPVGVGDLRADERSAAAPFKDIHIHALAFQRQPVGFHLGDHLHGMPADRQSGHVQAERAVGGAATRHGVGFLLRPVHVEGHGLRPGAGHGVGDRGGIVSAKAALREAAGDIVAARQAQGDGLHADVGLLLLRLAGGRVGGGGHDVDVARAQQQVLGQVEGVRALAYLLYRLAVGGGGAALHRDLHRGLLPGALPLLVAGGVLVVVAPREFHAAALLDGRVVHRRAQDDPCGGSVTAAASAACREIDGHHLRAALVGQRQAHGTLVVAQLGVRAENGVSLQFGQFRRHRRVLHGVGAVRVQALVHLHLVNGQAHVPLRVGILFFTVHRQALHRARAAEVLPRARVFPRRQARAGEPFRLPPPLRHLVGDAAALVAVFLIHRHDGRRQGVVAALQRNLLRHVVRVATAARATGNDDGGDFLSGLPQQGEFHRVVLPVRNGRHAAHQAAFHSVGGILCLCGGFIGSIGSGLCHAGLLVCRGRGAASGARGFRGIGCRIVRFRGRGVGCGSGVRGRFAQKGKRGAHQLGTTQRREALDVVQ